MIWLGYLYLAVLILFGASALLDDTKAKKLDRFLISLIPFAVFVVATVGFLFLPKPGGLSWLVFAALAVSVAILTWDSVQDVKNLRKTDPESRKGDKEQKRGIGAEKGIREQKRGGAEKGISTYSGEQKRG